MKSWGLTFITTGALLALWAVFVFEPTIANGDAGGRALGIEFPDRIVNLQLLQLQELAVLAGCALFVGGCTLFAGGAVAARLPGADSSVLDGEPVILSKGLLPAVAIVAVLCLAIWLYARANDPVLAGSSERPTGDAERLADDMERQADNLEGMADAIERGGRR